MLDRLQEDSSRGHPSVSDLIYCLTKSYFNMYNGVKPDRKTQTMFLVGLATEKALIGEKIRPTSGIYDGIVYHMDSLDYEDSPLDVKSTRSKKRTPEDFSTGWHKQLMAYAKIHGTNKFYIAVVYIIPAELEVWEIEYEPEDLETFWEWMQIRRDAWQEAVDIGNPPTPFQYNEDWECKGCPYLMICKRWSIE